MTGALRRRSKPATRPPRDCPPCVLPPADARMPHLNATHDAKRHRLGCFTNDWFGRYHGNQAQWGSNHWFDTSPSESDRQARDSLSGRGGITVPGKSLQIGFDGSPAETAALVKALSNETRIAILRYLGDRIVPVNQIAHDLGLPQSTATMHVALLDKAGLIQTELQPARRGLQKICGRRYDELVISLPFAGQAPARAAVLSTSVGAYADFHVEPSCGLASSTGLIGLLDDPQSFWEPARIEAQLLWFRSGFVEYVFPSHVPAGSTVTALQFSAEICSEAPLSDPDWPSDISVWINGVNIGTWTSPADFGDHRGLLNPAWWGDRDTQHGLLKRWRVTEDSTSIDGVRLSAIRLADLEVRPRQPVRVRIGVPPDADNVGGVNLFGRGFGNYPQDLELRLEYE